MAKPTPLLLAVAVLCAAGAFAAPLHLQQQPNPPAWPSSVAVFHPSDSDIQAKVDAAYAQNGGHNPPNNGQFSSARFAFLFAPGTYPANLDVPVGFYTTVAGLGASPDDTVFTSPKGVYCEEGDYLYSGGALDTFWRAAENFRTQANFPWATGTGMLWAVSQAAPLRSIHVDNNLALYEYEPPYQAAGYSSGGFAANLQVDNKTLPGSQQQFLIRNTALGQGANPAVWNLVLSGCSGAPASHCSNQGGAPVTNVAATPLIAEKPFLALTTDGKFSIRVPPLRQNAQGPAFAESGTQAIPFEQVYVSQPSDTAAILNQHLAAGLHLVLSPAIYQLDAPLLINTTNQIVFGLGLATLVSAAGNPVLQVGAVDGVRISGLLLQAGPQGAPALLEWGNPGAAYAGSASNPGFIYDVYARVGGPDTQPVHATSMVHIHNNWVVIDNMWLWRADHTVSGIVSNSDNPCQNGLVVTADNVYAYGLAAEHSLGDQVQWAGDSGLTIFFQSELPYDVTQENYGDKGYVGYRVNATVGAHRCQGCGVYHFFRDYAVTVASGISVPPALESSFTNPFSVFLNGKGTMQHIINDKGNPTAGPAGGDPAYYCS